MKKLLILSVLFLSTTAGAQTIIIHNAAEQKVFTEWVESMRVGKVTSSEDVALARVSQIVEEKKYENDLFVAGRTASSNIDSAAVLKEISTVLPKLMGDTAKRIDTIKEFLPKTSGMTKGMLIADLNAYMIAHKDFRGYKEKLPICNTDSSNDFCVKFVKPTVLAQLKIMTVTVNKGDDEKFADAKEKLDKILK